MQIPKPSENGNFEPAPAGSYVATCYRFVDLGTQMTTFQGENKTRHEVLISWELADAAMGDGRPFTINKTYTWSMNEKATLRKDLEAWRGRPFVDEDFEGPNAFNTKKLIGAPCMMTILNETKDGKTYAKIASVGKLIKGMQAPPCVNAPLYLSLTDDGWDASVYAELSDYYKGKIAASPEYRDLMSKRGRPDDPPHAGDEFSDEVPF